MPDSYRLKPLHPLYRTHQDHRLVILRCMQLPCVPQAAALSFSSLDLIIFVIQPLVISQQRSSSIIIKTIFAGEISLPILMFAIILAGSHLLHSNIACCDVSKSPQLKVLKTNKELKTNPTQPNPNAITESELSVGLSVLHQTD